METIKGRWMNVDLMNLLKFWNVVFFSQGFGALPMTMLHFSIWLLWATLIPHFTQWKIKTQGSGTKNSFSQCLGTPPWQCKVVCERVVCDKVAWESSKCVKELWLTRRRGGGGRRRRTGYRTKNTNPGNNTKPYIILIVSWFPWRFPFQG